MQLAVLTVTLRLAWAHSLKDKRSEVKSLLAKLRGRFNVSAAESGSQDSRQQAEIAVATLAATTAQAHSILAEISRFIRAATDAEILQEAVELR